MVWSVVIAALAIAFWTDVLLLRLIVAHLGPDSNERAWAEAIPSVMPAPRVDIAVAPLPIIDHAPPGIPLTRAEVVRDLEALQPKLDGCGLIDSPPRLRDDPPPSPMLVKVVILEDGRVATAEVKGKLAGSDAARCVEAMVLSTRFGFSTAEKTLNHRFRLNWHRLHMNGL